MVSPWQYSHLLTWERSLSFSHLGNLLAINYMQAKNIHLYIYIISKLQLPTGHSLFWCPRDPKPHIPVWNSLFYILLYILYQGFRTSPLTKNLSLTKLLRTFRTLFSNGWLQGLSDLSLCYSILSKNPDKSLKLESPILNIWSGFSSSTMP